MILGVALKAAAAGIAATLAACSATNMYQTHTLLQLHAQTSSCPAATPASPGTQIAATDVESNNNDADYQLRSAEQTVDDLTRDGDSSRRRELLQLFLRSQAPSIDDIQGEWTGILLDNNSWVMTTVTAVITHKLFGRGRQWRGKLIFDNWTGVNRFSGDHGTIETAHEFQYQIGPSKLDGTPSLKHDYAPFHEIVLSPWSSMKDELRWVKCSSGKVMIGIGYFGWSGGVLNSSPFLLYNFS